MADILDSGNPESLSLNAGDGDSISLPEDFPLAEAEFQPSGDDLVITGPDGEQITVEDYFAQENPPELTTPDGAEVSGDMVVQLSGGGETAVGGAEGDVLSAGTDEAGSGSIVDSENVIGGTDGEPIGSIENVSGTVFAVRTDGTRVELQEGDQVFQGDILESGADGSIGVLLADETTFSMGEEGRMVLDEMIYDPGTQEGSVSMSVLQGVFTFVSGQVAKTDPDAMTLDTPVATIGIRGTQIGIDLTEGEDMNVVLMEEADGFVGEIVVSNDAGVQVLNGANQITSVRSYDSQPLAIRQIEESEMVGQFSTALEHLPLIHGNQNDFGLQNDRQGEFLDEEVQQLDEELDPNALDNFDTAAGQAEGEAQDSEVIQASDAVEETDIIVGEGEDAFNVFVETVGGTPVGEPGPGAGLASDPDLVPAEGPRDLAPVTAQVIDPSLTLAGGAGADIFEGGIYNDQISGGGGADVLVGGGGSDTIDGGLGNDILVGGTLDTENFTVDVTGAGDVNLAPLDGSATQAYVENSSDGADILKGGAGDDVVIGGAGADVIEGGAGDDVLVGGTGADDIKGDAGDDIVFGGADDDKLSGGEGADLLYGGTGDDVIDGDAGDDQLFGGDGNDVLNGGAGADFVSGGAGDDTLIFQDLDDTFDGGDGIDTLIVEGQIGNEDLVINLAISDPNTIIDGTGLAYGDRIFNVENVIAGAGDDTITGSSADNIITGGAGDDLIIGGGGRDIAAFTSTLDETTVTIDEVTGEVTVTGPNGTDTLNDIDVLSFGDGTIVAPMLEDTEFVLDNGRVFDGLEGADTVTISGLPEGASLSAGTDNGDGTWTLSATGTSSLADVLSSVSLSPAANSNEDFTITVTGQTAPTLNNLGETVPGTTIGGSELTLLVQGVIDFELSGNLIDSTGLEDQPVPLNLDADIDIDVSTMDNSEALSVSITISNVPAGSGFVSAGDRADDSVVSAQLADGTTVDFLRNDAGDFVVSGFNAEDLASVLETITVTPPLNHDEDFTLQLTTQVSETDGATETTVATKFVDMEAVADAPTLTVGSNISTVEDSGRVALEINAEQTDPSEVMSISIEGLPDGATIEVEYAPGQFIELPAQDGVVSVPTQFMNSLFITPAEDSNEDFTLTVNATSTEPDNNDQATTSLDINVDVQGVADTIELDGGLSNVNVPDQEPRAVTYDLDISTALNDADAGAGRVESETMSITIRVVSGEFDQNGDRVTFDGYQEISIDGTGIINNGDGSFTITDGAQADVQAILDGLQLSVGANVTQDFELEVTATTTDREVADADGDTFTDTQDTQIVIPVEVANNPDLGVHAAEGFEDNPIVLNLEAALTDTEGETLSITISDIPDGAVLTSGGVTLEVVNGQITFSEADINGGILTDLHIQAPANSSDDFILAVSATSTTADGDIAEVDLPLPVQITGMADDANLNPDDVLGDAGVAIPLTINTGLNDTDGSETLSVTITNIPEGAVLSAGTVNTDGSVTLTAAELEGLTITTTDAQIDNFTLFVSATTTEADGDTATVSDILNVTLDAGAQAPTVTLGAAQGAEDSAIPLNIDITPEDLSETLSVTISGIPEGAVLSAGTLNTDGTVTFTDEMIDAGVLANLTITPPADSNVDFNLNVAVTSTDGADQVTVTDTLAVDVVGVADAPNLTTADATGGENTAIALDLTSTLNDVDGSESLSITISNIPDGATLSTGVVNLDGSVTLSADQLVGLTITPALNSEQDFALQVTATSSENDGDTASITGVINVDVVGGADAPTLVLGAAQGAEDSAIPLNIDITPEDLSETLSVTISGIPEGAVLSAGTLNADGTVTFTDAMIDAGVLADLTITPPADSNVDFNLNVAVTSTDGADQVTVTDTLAVDVVGVADAPNLTTADATGGENTAIALDLTSTLNDVDGSESLSITISNIPVGATLSTGVVNLDGSVTLSADQLVGLTITPALNSEQDFALQVTATSSENDGDTASITGVINVDVFGGADAPTLTLTDAAGSEDSAIALSIDTALTDGTETLSITISDIPEGSVLMSGDVVIAISGTGVANILPEQLTGLTITPPEDSNTDFSLTVTATSTTEGGEFVDTTAIMDVEVKGVADAPTLQTTNAVGSEDNAIALDITSAVTDMDGSETLSITVSGVPVGATLSAGTDNGDGSWTLSATQLDGLSITPPTDFDGEFDLSVVATSTDTEASGETQYTDTASVTGTIHVTVENDAEPPVLVIDDVVGDEDTPIALNIDATASDGSELLSISISGIPDGATLSAGTVNLDGSITLTPGELVGLTITPPDDSNVNFDLSVTATSQDGTETFSTTDTMSVDVEGVADIPTLSVSIGEGTVIGESGKPGHGFGDQNHEHNGPHPGQGNQGNGVGDGQAGGGGDAVGTVFPLSIESQVTDTDGSESLSVTVSGLPADVVLSAGVQNLDGTWTLETTDLVDLNMFVPEGVGTDFNILVTSTSTDSEPVGEAPGTDTASVSQTVTVDLDTEAEAPTLDVSDTTGNEDGSIALNIDAALTDTDGSESLSITISDIPEGAVLSAGTINADGSVSLTPAELNGLTITPPENSNVDFNLSVSATSTEMSSGDTATTTATIGVDVVGVADAPGATAQDGAGVEDNWIQLNLDSQVSADTDGSETLSIMISDVPEGARLNPGTDNGDGTWSATAAELPSICILPPDDFSGEINMTLSVTTTEDDGDTATTDVPFTVTVAADADTPDLDVTAAQGLEDTAIDLDISAAVTDASETLSITISDIPDGASLSVGTLNVDGSVTLTPDQLSGLQITPPADSNVDFNLTVTATSQDGDDTATTVSSLPVDVAGVADAATLNVSLGEGVYEPGEDGSTTISVTNEGNSSAGYNNTYGYYIKGEDGEPVEGGVIWSNIKEHVGDTESLDIGDVDPADVGFFLIPNGDRLNPDMSDDTPITFQQDESGNWQAVGADGTVLDGQGADILFDDSTLNTNGFDYMEDTNIVGNQNWEDLFGGGDQDYNDANFTANITVESDEDGTTTYPLNIDAALVDTDGSETLSITVSGLPDDVVLSVGTVNEDGSVTLTPAELDGLTISVPGELDDEFNLTVSATTTEDDGDTTTVTQTVNVEVFDDEADGATLSAGDVSGDEDSAIALDIGAALVDTDGSESLSITIADVPEGAVLSAGTDNNDGTWTLSGDQLDGLTVTPPENSNTDFSLSVTATAIETATGNTSVSTASLDVVVSGVADAPSLGVVLGDPTLVEVPGETPEPTTVFSSTFTGEDGFVDSIDGWGTDSDAIEVWNSTRGHTGEGGFIELNDDKKNYYDDATSIDRSFETEQGATYTLTFEYSPRAGYDADVNEFQVKVDGEVLETLAPDGSQNTDNEWQSHTITFVGTGEPMGLEFLSTGDAVKYGRGIRLDNIEMTETSPGDDGQTTVEYPLDITAGLTDTDGSESLSISVSGLPEGASLSSGTDNGDGSWTLESDQLDSLSMSVPDNSDDFTLNVSATATEDDGDSAMTSQLVQVDVASDGFTGGLETLEGGDGMDMLFGSDGDDVIIGGGGDDILSGGAGEDAFVFDTQSGHDIVTDLMEQDTLVFEGQEFHMDDLILSENSEGNVVVSFDGVEGSSVTLDGVTADDLNVNSDTNTGDGYSVTEDGGTVTITIDNIT